MCDLYKLELVTKEMTNKVSAVLHWFGADHVVEGSAIVTDYDMSESEAEILIAGIGICPNCIHSGDELTPYDIQNFDCAVSH